MLMRNSDEKQIIFTLYYHMPMTAINVFFKVYVVQRYGTRSAEPVHE